MPCIHNARARYSHGFLCEDCNIFFPKDSPTYRSDELLSDIWMVLHNINARRGRKKLPHFKDVKEMRDKIGIGIKHENYEELIKESEIIMKKYGVNSNSALIQLR